MKWCVLIAALALCATQACAQDKETSYGAVELYLADLGLTELRAEYLESQLDSVGGLERVSLARRLAELYAVMLVESADDAERSRIEARATALLTAMPQVESDELRLSLARASFERAEAVLERWRLREVSEDEARGSIRRMPELAREFERLGREAHDRIERLESREERARDAELPMIESRIEDALERRSTSFYLAGWAFRYGAEFTDDPGAASASRTAFGWLLNARLNNEPELDRIPDGFASLPHVALSMLSVSYSYAHSGNSVLCDRWYERVESTPALPESVRAQLPTRRLIMLCTAGRWDDAAAMLDALAADDERAVLAARIGAVFATATITEDEGDARAARLRDTALASLVARGELGQAVEVVDAFPRRSITADGFVGGLINAVVQYQALRERQREEGDALRSSGDPETIRGYREVASTIEGALGRMDAAQYASAHAGALLVVGLARFYAGDYAVSANAFERAADAGAGTPVEPDALWMAVVSLDGVRGDTSESFGERRGGLIDRFLDRYPDHPRASTFAMRRAIEGNDDPERSLRLLLDIEPGEAAYETARRQAAAIAYTQAVQATSGQREFRSRRFLQIAEPLLAADRRRAPEDSDAAHEAYLTARRILGVALAMEVPDLSRAARAFDAIDSMAREGLVDTSDAMGELTFRRAELALAAGDLERAEEYLAELARTDPDLAAQGDRLLWRDALRDWRRTGESDDGARRVVRVGERLVEGMGEAPEALTDDANASVYRAVALASAQLWRSETDSEARALAQRLFGALIEHRAESREAIEGFVEMARAGGEFEQALEAQRRLVAGLEPGTRAWFGARTTQLELLADVDGQRAREAMRQHVALYPDLGPEPWRARLRDLARRLNVVVGGGM